MVEFVVLGPQTLDDMQPFLRHLVAVRMVELGAAEHFDFRLEPAGDDVHDVAAIGDVIDGGAHLGGEDGMDGRHMGGREDARLARRGADGGGPGKALETLAIEICDAPKALPAPHRHEGLELHGVGHLGEVERRGPIGLQHAIDGGDGAAAAEIGGEGAQLQLAVVEKRMMHRP